MGLKDFEAILHLSVVFNFIYAVSANFSKEISIFFAFNFKKYAEDLVNKYSLKVAEIKGKGAPTKISIKADKAFIELSNTLQFVLQPEKYDLEYNLKFKGIYLLTGLYAMFILLLSGLQHYIDESLSYALLFLFNVCVTLFFAFTFILTFFKSIKPIALSISLFLFIFLCTAYFLLYNLKLIQPDNYPTKYCTICFSITLVLLSFPLHFFRVLLLRIYIYLWVLIIRIKYRTTFKEIDDTADKYDEAKAIIKEFEDPL